MPVWIAVGVVAVLAGVVVPAGPLRLVLCVAGVLAISYGVGQYLGQTRKH